jgi:hypothetical protein
MTAVRHGGITQVTDRCIHEFEIGQCGLCKEPPPGVNPVVYITQGGMAFHNDPRCRTLTEGQLEADGKGLNIHPITPIKWAVANETRRRCRNCCG